MSMGFLTAYSIDFLTKAPMCEWSPTALCDVFVRGLGTINMNSYIMNCRLCIQARRRERRSEFQSCSALPHSSSHSRSPVTPASSSFASTAPVSVEDPEPMQLGRTRLSPEESERRPSLCMYCGQPGHFVSRCPVKARAYQ